MVRPRLAGRHLPAIINPGRSRLSVSRPRLHPLFASTVYRLRPFRNTDPPSLAEIWRSQPPQRGMLQPVSAPLLEYSVFSKMHFDRQGLIVATKNDIPVGFVHAGFGPSEDHSAIDTSMGTTLLLMMRQGMESDALADQLLAASEDYLRSRGTKVFYAGGLKPFNSFYLGLYGGSEIPGVLHSNVWLRDACSRRGYIESANVNIQHCDLTQFRPLVTRKVRQLKFNTRVVETTDPMADNWWEACVWGSHERDRFELVDKREDRVMATASFWDVHPLSMSWGVCTAGLFDLYVEPDCRRRGCASLLLNEAFRLLRRRGVSTVEAQTMATNESAMALYSALDFAEVDHGVIYRKGASHLNGAAATSVVAEKRC
jgi:ribosomal protein S18 acetylase RimI-like enzyme